LEAIILAGGKAERLGAAAGGLPKALVRVAGRPLVAYQVALLQEAGVGRVIISCRKGQEDALESELADLPAEIVTAPEPEPLGRGGGLRFAARARAEEGDVFALNGDELLDIDLRALLASHREKGAAATVAIVPLRSALGIVDVGEGDMVSGFREAAVLPHWASCGVYVLGEEAIERLPERGDHERSTFPELAAEGRLAAFRHEGVWLTVNTAKDLRAAEEYLAAHPNAFAVSRSRSRFAGDL
jgi:NDP-sugar pyrophosphorylase family protein